MPLLYLHCLPSSSTLSLIRPKTHPTFFSLFYHRSFFHTGSTAMGIHGLSKVIGDNAKEAIKEDDIKNYFGRKVAIDASMSIYQFMIAVRQQDGQLLQNENGETTR
jgi:hypothetical protein